MENFADRYRGPAFLTLVLGTRVLGVVIIFPCLPALVWAVMLSILMYPMYRRLKTSFGMQRWSRKSAGTIAGSITTAVTFLIICVPFVLIGIFLYVQIGSMIAQLNPNSVHGQGFNAIVTQIDARAHPFLTRLGMPDLMVSDYVRQHST